MTQTTYKLSDFFVTEEKGYFHHLSAELSAERDFLIQFDGHRFDVHHFLGERNEALENWVGENQDALFDHLENLGFQKEGAYPRFIRA